MGWFGGTIFFGNIQLVKVEGCVPVRCVETALPWCFTDGWFFLFSVLIIFSSLGGGVVPSNPKFAPLLSLGVNLHMITKSFAFSKGVTNFARCKWSWLLIPPIEEVTKKCWIFWYSPLGTRRIFQNLLPCMGGTEKSLLVTFKSTQSTQLH